jgi:hypothetical protein
VDKQSVEDHTLLLIFIQAQVEKLAQITPALRCAKRIRTLDGAGTRVALLHSTVA